MKLDTTNQVGANSAGASRSRPKQFPVNVIVMPRRHKGERHPMMVRVPIDHHEVYKREADRLGMDYGTYFAWCMARLHELPWPAHTHDKQEVLPLTA